MGMRKNFGNLFVHFSLKRFELGLQLHMLDLIDFIAYLSIHGKHTLLHIDIISLIVTDDLFVQIKLFLYFIRKLINR